MAPPRIEACTLPEWWRLRLAISPETSMRSLLTTIIEGWATEQSQTVTLVDDGTDANGNLQSVEAGPVPPELYGAPSLREIAVRFSDCGTMQVLRYDDDRPGGGRSSMFVERCITLDLLEILNGASTEQAIRSLELIHTLADRIVEQFDVLELNLRREDRVNVCPAPPLMGPSVMMQLVDPAEVARHYDDPTVYWGAWNHRTAIENGKELVSRCRQVVDAEAYQQQIFKAQWKLAKENRTINGTRYGALLKAEAGSLTDGYQALWNTGPDSLSGFAYNSEQKSLDVTAWVDEGTDIPAREIARLLRWIVEGVFDDGNAIEEVRVTFPTREQAASQTRVLRDVGCRVFHCGQSPKDLVELDEL